MEYIKKTNLQDQDNKVQELISKKFKINSFNITLASSRKAYEIMDYLESLNIDHDLFIELETKEVITKTY